MVKQVSGDQVVVMPEGSQRVIGRDAMRINIAIGYAIANIIKTTLGPKGMDKMLVSDLGDIVITNDGATILEEMNVDHPTAKLMVEIAKTQDKEVGDGTTTSVVIAGNLLKNAGELIEQTIHPTTIIKGYELASKKIDEYLNEISEKVDGNKEALLKIALVSMGSKGIGSEDEKKRLANIIVDAVMQVVEEKDGKYKIDPELIKIEKKAGGEIIDTELVKGVVIDKEVVHTGMPKTINEAKIALIDSALEIEKTETDAKIEITSPEQMDAFLKQEEKMIEDMINKIADSGANVVFCQKGIDELAQHYLAKKGIMAVRRVKKSDMEKLAKATGARIITSLHDLNENDLGYAGIVEEKKVAGESMIFIEKCKNPKSVTIFIRGGTEHVVNEVERALVDARGAVVATLEDGSFVTGGGSIEMELSKRLMEFATEVGGREQLAIQAFAKALESIPKTLAENAGMDAIDTLVELRNKHKDGDGKYYGVDVNNGKVSNMYEIGVVEPTKVKRQAIASATETARLILRIDDIISSKGTSSNNNQSNPGMPEY